MGQNGKKLITDTPKFGNKPLVSKSEEQNIRKEKLNFSFLHFRQIENFGIGNCSSKWLISFLERLTTLGNMTTQQVLEDNRGSSSLRCHRIDWSSKNIPIERADLNWLPSEILSNEDEFPIMQFSLSTGKGRIIGYFDKESSIFHIILLDPEHNLQPSKKNNYQIQPTTIGISQYDDLLYKFDNISKSISKCKYSADCIIPTNIQHAKVEHNIIYIPLDASYYTSYKDLIGEHSLQSIFEMGILSLTQ